MATRQGDSEKLVKRIQAVADMGWRVEPTPDGWRVFDPRQGMYSIHKTYSDGYRSMANLVQSLEGGGLKEDEAKQKTRRLEARRQKLKDDRDAAERRTQAIQNSRQDMIAKAAGPYLTEAEEPDIDWLTQPHPSPWMRWMYITPKVAAYILEHHNQDNRGKGDNDIEKIRLIILSGWWRLTHQGMAFDQRGMLQDGQHRLYAILAAGDTDPDIKVPFAVFVGMPVENFKAIDEGRLRTAAQMFKKEGVNGGTHAITMLRAVKAAQSDNPRGYNRGVRMSTVEAFEMREKDPDNFEAAISLGMRGYKRSRISPGIMAAAYYLVGRVNGWDNAYVTAFFEGIITQRKYNTNLVLPEDDPRNVLLRKFGNARPKTPIDGLVWIVSAWNNLVRGHHPQYMRVGDDTPLPNVLRCIPGDGATPRGLNGEVDV